MKRVAGFTLIELMIVVAVVAILALIAIPSYQQQVRQARRAELKSFLIELQMRQERWRAERPQFATAADLGIATLLTTHPAARHYTITLTNVTATDYSFTATATGGQANDYANGTSCTPITLTKLTRGPVGCW